MIAIQTATLDDIAQVLPRSRALNDHEGIEISDESLDAALSKLLATPEIGGVWLVTNGGDPIGYAIVTFGYDLEFGGRDAFLTELWIDEDQRGSGAGAQALTLLDPELRERGVNALHLQVRPENPAMRLYEREGFVTSPRKIMTRRLS
jgi:ribosomal protein S18 acetylase RimI-like enzyme